MKHEISIGKKKPAAPPPVPAITIFNRIPKESAKVVLFLFADPFYGSVNDAYWQHLFFVLRFLIQTEQVHLYEKILSLKATTYDLFWMPIFDLWQRPYNDKGDTRIKPWTLPTLLAVSVEDPTKFVMMSGRADWTAGVDAWAEEIRTKLLRPALPVLPDGIAPPPTTTNQVAPPREDYTTPPPAPAATTSLLDNKTLLFTGIAVVAVLLMKGKKSKKSAVSGTGKRRGRPRKNAQVGEAVAQVAAAETVQELSAETTAKDAVSGTPKRRGRPKKAVKVGEVETQPTVAGKRRGRPKKAVKVGEVAPQVAAPESATVAGKRRGRPRKAAQVAETPPAGAPAS